MALSDTNNNNNSGSHNDHDNDDDANDDDGRKNRRKRSRWGEAAKTEPPPTVASTGITAASLDLDPQARIKAMQESVRARLAAAKAKLKRPAAESAAAAARPPAAKKAKVYDLDMASERSGTSMAVVGSSSTTTIGSGATKPAPPAAAAKSSNPYLAHRGAPSEDGDNDETEVDATIDPALVDAVGRPRKPRKELTFVEPGKYQELAEIKREREARAAAAGFLSGRKQGHTLMAISMLASAAGGDNDTADDGGGGGGGTMDSIFVPRADAHPETKMPVAMEWWDVDLLPIALREQVAAEENKLLLKQQSKAGAFLKVDAATTTTTGGGGEHGEGNNNQEAALEALRQRCYAEAKLENSRTSSLVQHIVPVRKISKQRKPVLHLTKKELKRQRKLRRQERMQKLQDLQAAGLVPAPEPRLTLSNFIKVLGDQAFLDPSQMEHKVQEQMEARQRAHLNRNASNKLTKEQRNAKLARKYQTDSGTTIETCIFFVRDVSHNYHRAKIDTNAQQFCLTGCVLEVPERYACLIVEGSPKAIQKFSRLLLVRMQWNGEDFPKDNVCEKVWQGIVPRRIFKGFLFQTAESEDQARKILKTKGVEHYWNHTADHASGKMSGLRLNLVADDDEDDPFQLDSAGDNDIIME